MAPDNDPASRTIFPEQRFVVWSGGIDPLTPRPLSPKGARGESPAHRPRACGVGISLLADHADLKVSATISLSDRRLAEAATA